MSFIKKICLFGLMFFAFASGAQAACNRTSLTRCLDSACVKDTSNMGERCALCGTSLATASAGASSFSSGVISNGAVPGYILSAGELSAAPSDPGKRYSWATLTCVEKVANCTADDVSDVYDKLIEQSCRFALSDQDYNALQITRTKSSVKTADSCIADISTCMRVDAKCKSNYSGCTNDADFSKFYSECSVSTGCGDLSAAVLSEIKSARAAMYSARKDALDNIIEQYTAARSARLKSSQSICKPGGKDSYVNSYCSIMPNSKASGASCTFGSAAEKQMAEIMAEYVDIACEKLNIGK